jgi:hypothetical protein
MDDDNGFNKHCNAADSGVGFNRQRARQRRRSPLIDLLADSAARAAEVLYALAFKHCEDFLIGHARTFAKVADLGHGCL